MCGIAGIVRLDGNNVDNAGLHSALTLMRHRGPDDEGAVLIESRTGKIEERGGPDTPAVLSLQSLSSPTALTADVAIANRRLSIIDLSPKGHQPMMNEDGTVWVVLNGEVYNYRELRGELVAAGHTFTGESDTEVIAHGYEQWGIRGLLNRMVGMWGLAVWDQKKRKLFLARDRFGIKPLYYHLDGDQIIFASEIKAIRRLFKAELNENRIAQFLWLKPYRSDETFFSGISQLMASYYAELDLDTKSFATTRYWEISNVNDSYKELDGIDEEARRFFAHFEQSIKLHMRSDVPVGTCLSGGLDSSSIVCLSQKLLKEGKLPEKGLANIERMKTFSSVPKEERISEAGYISAVVGATGVEPHYTSPTFEEFLSDFETLVSLHDEPFQGPSVYMQYRVMKLVKENGVKVLLDGQGSDEFLAGYQRYLLDYLKDLIHRGMYLRAIREFFSTTDLTSPFFGKYLRKKFGSRGRIGGIIKIDPPKDLPLEYPVDSLATKLRYDLLAGSIIELLKYEDANSMAFSIESRVPFLYHPLIEYAFGLPMSAKIKRGWTKFILREAMRGILPENVRLRRSKLGFPAPEEEWAKRLINEKPEWYLEIVSTGKYFDMKGFEELCKRILLKNHSEDIQLFWRIIILSKWAAIIKGEQK